MGTTSAAASSWCRRAAPFALERSCEPAAGFAGREPAYASRTRLVGGGAACRADRSIDELPQLRDRLRRSMEETLGERRLLDHVLVDVRALIQIQAEAGQVLQPEIAIGVDLGVRQPPRHVLPAARVVSEQFNGGIDAGLRERGRDRRAFR